MKSYSEEKQAEIDEQLRYFEEKEINLKKTEEQLYSEIKELEKSNTQLVKKIQNQSKESKEIEQEKITLDEINFELENKISKLSSVKQQLQENIQTKKHLINELEQEKILLTESTNEMENKIHNLEKTNKNLQNQLDDQISSSKESNQEKILLSELSDNQSKENKNLKKKYVSAAIAGILLVGVLAPYSFYMTSVTGENYMVSNPDSMKSGYLIQNLRGDTIDTYLSWRLVEGDLLHVNILNQESIDSEKVEIIKKVILSNEIIEIDNSLLHKGPKGTVSPMYVGWSGALNAASSEDTSLYIPNQFNFVLTNGGEGDITIELKNERNADGFSGWTNSIADESQNQILKSRITIFDVDSISNSEFETIVRHEFGHALGLAHSTAPEDLMYPNIETNFPYISECNVDAIQLLYDGGESSQVVCEI